VSGAADLAPLGYTRFTLRDATIVARQDAEDGIREAMREVRTLHCWASTVPGARAFQGRATAWGATLPGTDTAVVVRHAQHGGLLAPITGDLFLWPGRAPWELEVSERLRAAKVRTPMLVAYVLYPAGFGFCRCDVATARLPDGEDLPAIWRAADDAARTAILDAVGELVRHLGAAGAHHADLNVKNVYLTRGFGPWRAYVLDVDRVRFAAPGDAARVTDANLARLTRSLRKSREQFGLEMPESAIAQLEQVARTAGAAGRAQAGDGFASGDSA
jgi:3-deoxy-D-manno-octulosonic acid kinase